MLARTLCVDYHYKIHEKKKCVNSIEFGQNHQIYYLSTKNEKMMHAKHFAIIFRLQTEIFVIFVSK